MPTNIKCPNCGHDFPLEDALNDELKEAIEKEKQELRQQMVEYRNKKEEELRKKDEAFDNFKRSQEEAFRTVANDCILFPSVLGSLRHAKGGSNERTSGC